MRKRKPENSILFGLVPAGVDSPPGATTTTAMVSSVGPEATLFLEWAGPVIQQLFALALAGEGWAMFKAKEAPRSGLGFTSTCSCCLTWTCYGIAAQSPSIWVPNVFGVVVGTVTTAVFVSLTEQRMGTTLAVIAALAVAVLALMFGDVLPEDQAKQWTANIGILQAIVMLGNGAAVWPTVAAEGDSSALSVPVRPTTTPNTSPAELAAADSCRWREGSRGCAGRCSGSS